jgi:hypothetical protein
MFKKLLLGLAILGVSTPTFAQTSVATGSLTSSVISSNISCRNKARSKYFELGATNMSNPNDNDQWAIVNGMRTLVWCRNTEAIITVIGFNVDSLTELRDEIKKAF